MFQVIELTPEPFRRRIERNYDLKGRLLSEENGNRREYERRRDGPLIDYVKDERGLVTRTERDAYRNVLRLSFPDGSEQSWKYHPTFNFVTEAKDENCVISTPTYDAKGNRVEVIEAAGMPISRRTTMEYDAFGQLRFQTLHGATPAADVRMEYLYDSYGNRIKAIDGEGDAQEWTFDVMGNALTHIEGRGKTRTMVYNSKGWLMESRSALGFVSKFRYDELGNRIESETPIDGTQVGEANLHL